jgi:hypothetical protein
MLFNGKTAALRKNGRFERRYFQELKPKLISEDSTFRPILTASPVAAAIVLHLSHRERSDRVSDPGEGFALSVDRNPSPGAIAPTSPDGRGED